MKNKLYKVKYTLNEWKNRGLHVKKGVSKFVMTYVQRFFLFVIILNELLYLVLLAYE